MKKILIIIFFLPIVNLAQQTYVPDDNFENYLETNGMGNGIANDDYVPKASIDSLKILNVNNLNIINLIGIEDFDSLQMLYCSLNQILSLNLSQNSALIALDCNTNNLTSLDLRNGNNIHMNLSTTQNQFLFCIDVDDVSWSVNNWIFPNIDYWNNFSDNCQNEIYGCTDSNNVNYNPFATINNSSCDYPKTYIPDDNFEQALIDLGYDNLLDDSVITSCIDSVTELFVTYSNIDDLTGIEDFSSLKSLNCQNNNLTTLDLSANIALSYLNGSSNQLTNLDLNGLLMLSDLHIADNQLAILDVTTNIALNSLSCLQNLLVNLDVSNNTALTNLACQQNLVTSLDVSSNASLTHLECSYNLLLDIDLSSNIALTHLYCQNNQLANLDVSANIALNYLNFGSNNISIIDLNGIINLVDLNCYDNQLTSLDVSTCSALTHLYCTNNQITCLDVSANSVLIFLYCSYNSLETLNTKNGNWENNISIGATNNYLTCVEVDNVAYSNTSWMNSFDNIVNFSENCNYVNPCNIVSEIQDYIDEKNIVRIVDFLGKETKVTNQPLFYIYDDGTVEKKIIIE